MECNTRGRNGAIVTTGRIGRTDSVTAENFEPKCPLWALSRDSRKRYEMADKPAELEPDAGFASDLAAALERGQFFLVYQPTIDLETNGFAGVEALLRWRHPERGVLGPDLFIADLDRSGEIAAVGRWALVTACRDGASWHDKGYRFNVSVNISRRQFASDKFFEDVANALSASRFDPALLVLEFTQGTLAEDRDDSVARLARLRTLGVRSPLTTLSRGSRRSRSSKSSPSTSSSSTVDSSPAWRRPQMPRRWCRGSCR